MYKLLRGGALELEVRMHVRPQNRVDGWYFDQEHVTRVNLA
jgi:hypothetical protein